MHERTNIQLTAADRKKLESVVATIRKAHLASEDLASDGGGHGTAEIMGATDKSMTVIWRWQERFGPEGVVRLQRDKTLPLAHSTAEPRSARTRCCADLAGPPPTGSHWTGAAMANV